MFVLFADGSEDEPVMVVFATEAAALAYARSHYQDPDGWHIERHTVIR